MNVAKTITEILDKVKKEGFNGVKHEVIQKECVWHEQYAIFILQFRRPCIDDEPYVESEFNESALIDDFIQSIYKELPDVTIQYRPGCNEFEIVGKDFRKFTDKNAEEIEVFYEKHTGHSIFV